MDEFSRGVQFPRAMNNPSQPELRDMCLQQDHQETIYGSINFISEVRSRSAEDTYIVDDGVSLGQRQQAISLDEAARLAAEVRDYLANKKLIQVDRLVGYDSCVQSHCRLFVSADYPRLAYMWTKALFEPKNPDRTPDFLSIYVPEWPERKIFAHPEAGVTYILGTDYFGEAKKSFLRMLMYRQKKVGHLGFHAGSKVLRVCPQNHDDTTDEGFLLFGLSGTGKTTLTTHDHFLNGKERVVIRQDDVVVMNDQGECYGSEAGFFIKTRGLSEEQTLIYEAAKSPEALFENVTVDSEGVPHFEDSTLTGNGRAIVPRRKFRFTDDDINLPQVSNLIFITRRRDVLPPVARMTAEQSAAFFMLGESEETSAGDPEKAGQARREVGTNPFIIGPEAEEGTRLLEFLKKNPDIDCYLLNTGKVGFEKDITVEDSATIIKELARDSIRWENDPDWNYEIPSSIPGLDVERYLPQSYMSGDEYKSRIENLRRERIDWLQQFPDLDQHIIDCVK